MTTNNPRYDALATTDAQQEGLEPAVARQQQQEQGRRNSNAAVMMEPPSDLEYKEAGNYTIHEIMANRVQAIPVVEEEEHRVPSANTAGSGSHSHNSHSNNHFSSGTNSSLPTGSTQNTPPTNSNPPPPGENPYWIQQQQQQQSPLLQAALPPLQEHAVPPHQRHGQGSRQQLPPMSFGNYPEAIDNQRFKRAKWYGAMFILLLLVVAASAFMTSYILSQNSSSNSNTDNTATTADATSSTTDNENHSGNDDGNADQDGGSDPGLVSVSTPPSPPTVSPTLVPTIQPSPLVTTASPTELPTQAPTTTRTALAPTAFPTPRATTQPTQNVASRPPTTVPPTPIPTNAQTTLPTVAGEATNIQTFLDTGLWYPLKNEDSGNNRLHGPRYFNDTKYPAEDYGLFETDMASPPFVFTSTQQVVVRVTDLFSVGERITVHDNGVVLGTTRAPASSGTCGSKDPFGCYENPIMSNGLFLLDAGNHALEFFHESGAAAGKTSAFRVDTAAALTDISSFVNTGLWYQLQNNSTNRRLLHGGRNMADDYPSNVYGFFDEAEAPAPFLFESTQKVTIRVTDILRADRQIRVYDNGVLVGITSEPDPSGFCGSEDPQACFDSSVVSSGLFEVSPGRHALELFYESVGGTRYSAFRLDSPEVDGIQNFIDSGLWYQLVNDETVPDSNKLYGGNSSEPSYPSNVYGLFAESKAPPPFVFTSTLSVVLRVTDLFTSGQEITVYDGGALVGYATKVGTNGDCGSTDPQACFDDPEMSSGLFLLAPGSHSLEFFYDEGSSSSHYSAFRLDTLGDVPAVQLTASDGASYDYFGNAAIDGDTIIVGGSGDNANGISNSGSAYIFAPNADGDWVEQAKLVPDDAASGDQFGWGTVTVSGNRVAIGSRLADVSGEDSGSVYVFQRTAGTDVWTQVDKVSEGSANFHFGYGVALDGNILVVASRQGHAYIYENTDGSTWSLQFTISIPFTSDEYPLTAAVSGNTVAIGAPWSKDDTGEARVYVKSGANWTLEATLIPTTTEPSQLYGWSVAIDGDTMAVGCPWETGPALQSGSVYVYVRSGDDWSLQSKVFASDAETSDYFGRSVALDGDRLVVGTENDVGIYVFARVGGAWAEEAKLGELLAVPGDNFGWVVDISGNTVVVNAGRDDDKGTDSGSAYVFTL